MTDDDIRSMLHTKAQEATVSDDAWDKIASRLGRAETPVRHLPRRLALVGVAAAAVAGTLVVANLPGPSTKVANTTTTRMATSDVSGLDSAVTDWLATRLPAGVRPGQSRTTLSGDTAQVTFSGGDLATTLFLQRLSGRQGWGVVSAASDLVLIDNPTYDGRELVASATAEMDGRMTITYLPAGQAPVDGGTRQVTHTEANPLGYQISGADAVTVRVVLVTSEGVTAISEAPAQTRRDPATAVGSMVAVWPATDSAGLAVLQQDADAGRRPDLLDPQAVAGGFLSELLPRNETPTSFAIGAFQLGDNTSGEVPYSLDGKPAGTVLLRRTGGDRSIWYVTGATSDTLQILTTRREVTHLVADVQTTRAGMLTWTTAPSVPVQAGQKVSIGRPDTPLGNYPVVVRLMNGKRTLAIAAQLG
jgi:hypothetical protein